MKHSSSFRSSFLTQEQLMHTTVRKQHSNSVWLWYVFGVGLCATICVIWQVEPLPWHIHVIGILLIGICGFPIARWYTYTERSLPTFEMICLAYGIQYGLPLYLKRHEHSGYAVSIWFTGEEIFDTMVLVTLGVSSMIFAYYLAYRNQLIEKLPSVELTLAPHKRIPYLLSAFAVGLMFNFLVVVIPSFRSVKFLNAFISLFTSQSYIALILLTYYVYTNKLPGTRWRWLLLIGITLLVLLGLVTGMLELTIIPLVMVFTMIWQVAGKLPWRLLIVCLSLLLLLQPLKSSYRTQAWTGNNLTIFQRLEVWSQLIQDSILQTNDPPITDTVLNSSLQKEIINRLDLLHPFMLVQRLTPTYIPYYLGESYSYLGIGWVPRFLWPDKPIAQAANDIFAVDYGILGTSQIGSTTTGIGHIAEAFANFGVIGVVVIMGIEGALYAIVSGIFNRVHSEGGRAIYLSIMIFTLNGIGSAVAPAVVGLVQNSLAQALMLRPFCTSLRAKVEVRHVPGLKKFDKVFTQTLPSNNPKNI